METDWHDRDDPHTLALFDVDGTLTPARQKVGADVAQLLERLRKRVVIGFVGGSDLVKQKEQLGDDVLDRFDFAFSENGLTAFRRGLPLANASLIDFLGEDRYQELVNFLLGHLSTLKLPFKRGTFIEFRRGMINVSPVGRNCSPPERDAFEAYDRVHGVRRALLDATVARFPDFGLVASIGGQISFDLFPRGWDKTYCLRHVEGEGFTKIHFFGDKTAPGGNDHEIFVHPSVVGHAVASPAETRRLVAELFGV